MPQIRLSTTKLNPVGVPSLRVGSGWDKAIRAQTDVGLMEARLKQDTAKMVDTGIVAANHFDHYIDRAAEKDAFEAATVWESQMIAGVNGTVDKNGNRVGGIAQKTWQDYEANGSSPIKDIGEIEKRFQSSETYKKLTGRAREKFNNRVRVRRAQYLAAANKHYDLNQAARTKFFDEQADLVSDQRLDSVMFEDDETFLKTLNEESFGKMARKFRGHMKNPDVLDMPGVQPKDIVWKDKVAPVYFNGAVLYNNKKMSIARCEALAKNAAMGEVSISGGKVVTPIDKVEKAEAFANRLAEKNLIKPETKTSLDYRFAQARSQIDERIRHTVANRTAAAMAAGDLPTLETARREMEAAKQHFATKYPDGSVGQTVTTLAAKQLDEQADKRATYDIMNDLSQGKNLEKADGTSIFDPVRQARYAKLYPQVKKTWDDKVQKAVTKGMRAAHDRNRTAARAKMFECVANGTPNEFYNYLSKQVMDKKLFVNDFDKLKKEYDTGWMKGFADKPEMRSRQSQLAKGMMDSLNATLGIDLSAYVKTDEYGNPTIKNGTVEFVKDGKVVKAEDAGIGNVTVRRTGEGGKDLSKLLPWNSPLLPWNWDERVERDRPTTTETLRGEKLANLLQEGMLLWSLDGQELTYDPVTGEDLPNGKTHRVNALHDWNAMLSDIANERNILTASEELARRSAYVSNLKAQMVRNQKDIANKLVTGVENKSEEDKNDEE